MGVLTEPLFVGGGRVDDRLGRLREAFQGELSGVVDRLVTAAVAEAEAAAEKARVAGQTALNAALIELEQRTRQSNDLTESVRQLELQVEELRFALDVERELAKTATHKCELEQSARARAEAASEEAHRLRERTTSDYESKLQTALRELDAERARIRGLQQQLESQFSERARLLAALKSVQHASARVEATSEAFEAGRRRIEERPLHQPEPDVHNHAAATTHGDAAAGAKNPSGAASEMRHAAASAPTDSTAGRKLEVVGPGQRRAVDAPPSLADYAKQLFPRETPTHGSSSGVKTEDPRKPRPKSSL